MTYRRYRERNLSSSTHTYYRYGGTCGSENSPAGPYGPHTTALTYEKMWDNLTPHFLSRVKKGEILPTNLLKHKKADVTFEHGEVDWRRQSNNQCAIGEYAPGSGFELEDLVEEHAFPSSRSDIVAQSAKDAIARAKSPDLDLLTLLLEANSSIELFKGAARRFTRATERIARAARRRNPGQAVQEFSNMWLEGRYGWRTAYFDALDILEVLQDKANLRSRGWDQVTGTNSYSKERLANIGNGLTFTYTVNATTEWKIRTGSMFEISLDLPNIGLNPVVTAWELIPYSFVIDWFIDVGETLNAITPRPGFDLVSLWVSEEYKTTFDECALIDETEDSAPEYQFLSYSTPTYGGTYSLKLRRPVAHNEVSFLPHFEWNFNLLKLLDLIALLIQSKAKIFRILRG